MKNYIVYRGTEMVRRFDTAAEAIAWVDKVAAQYSEPARAPEYRVCYNGHTSVQVYSTKSLTLATV